MSKNEEEREITTISMAGILVQGVVLQDNEDGTTTVDIGGQTFTGDRVDG